MLKLWILLHPKRSPDFVSSPANFCQLLLSFVGCFDVFPYQSLAWLSWHRLSFIFHPCPIYRSMFSKQDLAHKLPLSSRLRAFREFLSDNDFADSVYLQLYGFAFLLKSDLDMLLATSSSQGILMKYYKRRYFRAP